MMLPNHSRIFLCLLGLVFFSCKNDIQLNAPYKEYPSIYAVLNAYETVQMIRINKVFLGVGDANQMAKVADSVNYQPGELTVTLTRTLNDYTVAAGYSRDASGHFTISENTVTFRDSVVQTVPGAF